MSLTLSATWLIRAIAASPLNSGDPSGGQNSAVSRLRIRRRTFTQPSTLTSPEQILRNPAAPYINSLVNPGNPNAAQVSYARKLSERGGPAFIRWSLVEAGSNLGIFNDNEPSPATSRLNPTAEQLPATHGQDLEVVAESRIDCVTGRGCGAHCISSARPPC